MTERESEWVNRGVKERTNKWASEWVKEWTSEWVSEWTNILYDASQINETCYKDVFTGTQAKNTD